MWIKIKTQRNVFTSVCYTCFKLVNNKLNFCLQANLWNWWTRRRNPAVVKVLNVVVRRGTLLSWKLKLKYLKQAERSEKVTNTAHALATSCLAVRAIKKNTWLWKLGKVLYLQPQLKIHNTKNKTKKKAWKDGKTVQHCTGRQASTLVKSAADAKLTASHNWLDSRKFLLFP